MARRRHHITIRTDSGVGQQARMLAKIENGGRQVTIRSVYLVTDEHGRPTGQSDYVFHPNMA